MHGSPSIPIIYFTTRDRHADMLIIDITKHAYLLSLGLPSRTKAALARRHSIQRPNFANILAHTPS